MGAINNGKRKLPNLSLEIISFFCVFLIYTHPVPGSAMFLFFPLKEAHVRLCFLAPSLVETRSCLLPPL